MVLRYGEIFYLTAR
jgi:hypothetical protein